jgi:predicted lipoprotein with Yx(FWY)xxD motif
MRWIALVALVAAVGLLGAGCGDDDDNGDQATTQTGAAMKDESDAAMKDESGGAMKDEGKMKGGAMSQEAAMKSDASTSAAKGRLIKAVGSEYGRVVADGKGEAFYVFGKESSAKSKCYGACAAAWPPVLTNGKPRAGKGVTASLLGTTKRANGKLQATYDGQPLYYYVDDTPGNILCQNVSEFGGLWLVVSPGGAPVT